MPLYGAFGNAIFGETVFGAPPAINNATQMFVLPNGYSGLKIEWFPPGTPGVTWTRQKLMRSSFGTPTTITDGQLLLDESLVLPWQTQTSYAEGSNVSYLGSTYKCIQAIDMNQAMPPATPPPNVDTNDWLLLTDAGIPTGTSVLYIDDPSYPPPPNQGIWQPANYYVIGDTVTYGTQTFICTQPVSDSDLTPVQDGIHWQYLSNGVPLKPGHCYYYALFVYDPILADWTLSASAQGLVLTNWSFSRRFVEWLPNWYLDQDSGLGNLNESGMLEELQGLGPLERFLNLLGFEEDWIRSEIESLFTLTDGDLVSGAVLPYLGANFGIGYEPELGMARYRVLVKNAVHLYKQRGTNQGIAAAASAYSGFGCEVTIGSNLEIQLDDGAFDRSAGHWTLLFGGSLVPTDATAAGVTPQHTDYLPANNTNVGLITALGGLPVAFSNVNETTAPTLGIPVNADYLASLSNATPLPAPTYELFGYFRPYSMATPPQTRSWKAQLDWYALNGAFISSTMGAASSAPGGLWTRVSVQGTPPVGAAYIGRTFSSTANLGAGERQLVDAIGLHVVAN